MQTLKPLFLSLSLTILALVNVPVAMAQKPAAKSAPADLVTELHNKGFNTLIGLLAKTDLLEKLASGGPYTILAPTDNAFRDIPKAQLDGLGADKEKLTAVLSNHIIDGKVSTADLKSGKVNTLAGNSLEAKVVDKKIKLKTATVVRPDLAAANGVIHGIDKVLLP